MIRRLTLCGEVKEFSSGAVAKASPNWAHSRMEYDPKPGDLPMARLKRI